MKKVLFSLLVAISLILSVSIVSAYYGDYSTYSKTVIKTPWTRTVEIQKDTPYGTSYYYSSKDYRGGYYNPAYRYWKGYDYYPEDYYRNSYYQIYYPEEYSRYSRQGNYNPYGWRY